MPERCDAKLASYRDDSERRFALRRHQVTTARSGVLSAEQLIQPARHVIVYELGDLRRQRT
ncbi:MAG: hypothetical protein DMF98_09290 [Acidobacteria bacterium]|nr:MAG: hypothetical protein DMF98_09290 [Acidobacteriota bacterium]